MLTKKVIGIQLRISVLKYIDRFYRFMPIKKQRKFLYLLRNQFRKKKLESLLRRQIVLDNFGAYAKGILFETSNGLLVSQTQDVEINNRLGFQGQYDLQNIEYIMNYLDETTNMYVLGAHIGSLLIPLSGIVKTIIAFEANPETFRYLEINIPLNKINNAQIYNLSVYNSNTRLKFYQSKANTGGSKIKPINDRFIYNYDSPTEIEIEAIALDEFIQKNNLPQPDFIIMDIEGAEFFALQGSASSLAKCKYLYIEFVPHHLLNVSRVGVTEFLSVITPYFSKMRIIGREEEVYTGKKIVAKLTELNIQNRESDLLFSK